jgi:malate dehydrogenase (oxaloacetate-decarboxylating)(NADP+)
VVLAGVLSTLSLCGKKDISEHTFVFLGAGEAGVGIANMIAVAISKARGCSLDEARKQIWLIDSVGLLHAERPDIKSGEAAHHKLPFAHPLEKTYGGEESYIFLESAIDMIKPTALVGVSAKPGTFTPKALTSMAINNKNPLIFALSNPTSKAECTAQEAYTHTRGKCVFASGSPFDPVTLPNGQTFTPGQGNNAYIFPGVGLGAIVSEAAELNDEDFYIAAVALSKLVDDEALAKGCAYPPLSAIRDVSAIVAAAVAENVIKSGRCSERWGRKAPPVSELVKKCKEVMFVPSY